MGQGPWAAALVALGCAAPGLPSPELEHAVARSLQARHDWLLMRCEPGDAEVYVDGVPRGPCGSVGAGQEGLRVGPGLHRVDVKREGYWPHTLYHEPSRRWAGVVVRLRPRDSGRGGQP